MREDDILRLSLRTAELAVAGAPFEQVLADGIATILDTDAGTGVTNWAGPNRPAPVAVEIATAGAPSFAGAQVAAAIAVSTRHPRFTGAWDREPTHRVSDHVSLPEFWETDVWRTMHGHADGRYPAASVLSCTRDAIVFVGVHRRQRDFDDDDMAVLDLLRQPLASAIAFRVAWDEAIRRCRDDGSPRTRDLLTPREAETLGLVALGWTNIRIGRHLRISERTVRKHLENVNDKLGTTNRAAAVHRWHARST